MCMSAAAGHVRAMIGWHVTVEVLLLRLLDDEGLGHRWVRGVLSPTTSPDERAVELAGCTVGVCHSTSWRRAEPSELILTYAALPDSERHLRAEPLDAPLTVLGGAALAPTPPHLQAAHVAAHAVRHLADLAERDPVVQAQACKDPLLWAAVRSAARHAEHSHAEHSHGVAVS